MPQDRLCKRCGKIGHIRKNCPDNNIGSRKNREKDDFKSKKRSESGEMNDSCCDNQKFLKMLSQLNMVDSGESRANSAVVGTKPTYGGNAPKTEGVVNENSSQGGARRRPEKDFFNRNEGKMSNENLRRKNGK